MASGFRNTGNSCQKITNRLYMIMISCEFNTTTGWLTPINNFKLKEKYKVVYAVWQDYSTYYFACSYTELPIIRVYQKIANVGGNVILLIYKYDG